ncbi:MAG: hypothetical protein WCH10_03140 [bacterium]
MERAPFSYRKLTAVSIIVAFALLDTPTSFADEPNGWVTMDDNVWTSDFTPTYNPAYFGTNSGLYLSGTKSLSTQPYVTEIGTTSGDVVFSGNASGAIGNITIGKFISDRHGTTNVVIGGAPTAGTAAAVYFSDTSADSSNITYDDTTQITTHPTNPNTGNHYNTTSTTLYITSQTNLKNSEVIYFDSGNTTLDISNVAGNSSTIKSISSAYSDSYVNLGTKTLKLSNADDDTLIKQLFFCKYV